MGRLELRVFVNGAGRRDEEAVSRWQELASSLNLPINIALIDLATNPDQATEYDIVFTPTTIAILPNGKQWRYVGYTTDIDLIIRSCGWYSYSQALSQNVQDILRRNESILADTQKMKEETLRMRTAAQKMRDQMNKS